eukprot:3799261-Prymnesium_polylepis.1
MHRALGGSRRGQLLKVSEADERRLAPRELLALRVVGSSLGAAARRALLAAARAARVMPEHHEAH